MPLTDGEADSAAAVAAENATAEEASEQAEAGLLAGGVAARDNLVGIAGV